jgi:uncharacterized OB-fold protein
MTGHAGKFLPRPRPETAAWWESCREHKLMIQRCSKCRAFQFYPRIICSSCTSGQIEWVQSTGQGKVVTFTICRVPVAAAYAAELPYVVALIQLQEGPTMMSNIVNCDPDSVFSGMGVEVVFETWTEEITMPQFQPFVETASQ